MMYRRRDFKIEVFLVQPGGSFWAKKDLGAWSISRREYLDQEDHWKSPNASSRKRPDSAPEGPVTELGDLKQPGGNVITAWVPPSLLCPAALGATVR